MAPTMRDPDMTEEQRLDERYAHLIPETREHMKRKHHSLFDGRSA